MSEKALDFMWTFILESGKMWGETAADFQIEDAEAIQNEDVPNLHFLTRPRGGSKSTDISAIILSWLAVDAPPLANGHVLASNVEQAGIIIDAAAAFIARTPDLQNLIKVESERLIGPNGAWVRILPQSASGAWGLRDAHLLICDEFCQWDETKGSKRVWTAVRSTVQKVPGCRLILLSSAPEPSHWTYPIMKRAETDSLWHVHAVLGPVPWHSEADIEGLRRDLLPSEFDRLVLNIPSESEDRAISPEDYARAVQPSWPQGAAPAGIKGGGVRMRHPLPLQSYILTVDIGIRHDATVLCVGHSEIIEGSEQKRVVVDHIERWLGSKRHHVQLKAVQNRIIALAMEYNNAEVHADPSQFMGAVQALNGLGVRAYEWPFTATSVGQLATSLVQAFHNGQIYVPESDELEKELLQVRLRESTPGITRLDHDKDKHDDQAVTIGMICELLLKSTWGQGAAWMQFYKDQIKKREDAAPSPPTYPQNNIMSTTFETFHRSSSKCYKPQYRPFENPPTCLNCGLTPDKHLARV